MDFFDKIEEYENKASLVLEAKLNDFLGLIYYEKDGKELQLDKNIKEVYLEVQGSTKIKAILSQQIKNKNSDFRGEEEDDIFLKYKFFSDQIINKEKNIEKIPTYKFISPFNQDGLQNFDKFYSKDSENQIIESIIRQNITNNVIDAFYSILNFANTSRQSPGDLQTKYKKNELPFFSNFTIQPSISSMYSPTKVTNFTNKLPLYIKPEVKEDLLTTKFVVKKTFEFLYNRNLNKKVDLNECKKKFKLKPIRYDFDVETNLKLVDEIVHTKKKEENVANIKLTKCHDAFVNTRSKYYIKLDRNCLEEVPKKLKDIRTIKRIKEKEMQNSPTINKPNIKGEYSGNANKLNKGNEGSKKRILSSRYKLDSLKIV